MSSVLSQKYYSVYDTAGSPHNRGGDASGEMYSERQLSYILYARVLERRQLCKRGLHGD